MAIGLRDAAQGPSRNETTMTANEITTEGAGMAFQFHAGGFWPGASEFLR
jgi:hypothetical protein